MDSISTVFDTSIATRNLGDHIIMDAVITELEKLLPRSHLIHLPSHLPNSLQSYRLLRKSTISFVGGTNLLSSNLLSYRQWKIGIFDIPFFGETVLMGVGWWQYQTNPDLYTKFVYRNLLSKNILHSVRDQYALTQLKHAGIDNVVNTGCPTMWNLTQAHCQRIPENKSENVIFTLTDYRPERARDQELINDLERNYRNVYFWPQGIADLEYLSSLTTNKVVVLSPSLSSLDNLMADTSITLDYVGTRLHAGIRALQHFRRSLIIAVDNRAAEISKDTGLPIFNPAIDGSISKKIGQNFETRINLPWNSIDSWRNGISEFLSTR